tara:strand:+ start:106047 stop:106625 length:579 start_codon:yes stop_codon:yes gene_type:complete
MIVGITGGIGAGKTTVSNIFGQLGIPVYEADYHSKNLLDIDEELKSSLVELLGNSILNNSKIDREKMAAIIFNDEQLLKRANALIHPRVALHFEKWRNNQKSPYIIKEAAILFESGSYKDCDKVIVVSAPKELRIERVKKRSGLSRQQIMARMEKQWPEEQKIKLADYIVINDGEHSLIKQSLDIHRELLNF